MLANNAPLSDEETDSELYLDALDVGACKENIVSKSDGYELDEYQSSVCIWEHNIPAFQIGVYSQFIEARVVLNNNYPKYDLTCRYPERRNLHVKKIEETVLTCHLPNEAARKRCAICYRASNDCICGKAFIQTKPSNSSQKKKISTICAAQAKCNNSKTKYDGSEVFALLEDVNRSVASQRYPTKLTSQTVKKWGNCRIPGKCGCRNLGKNQSPNLSYSSKLSYLSSEELQLIHAVKGSEPSEILKHKQCYLCDTILGSCTCGSLKKRLSEGKCKYCCKPISSCSCPRKKNNDSMSLVTLPRQKLGCIHEKKINEDYTNLTGIIQEVIPRTQSISSDSFNKRPGTPKSKYGIDTTPRRTIRKVKEPDLQEIVKKDDEEILTESNRKMGGRRMENRPSSVRPLSCKKHLPLKVEQPYSKESENPKGIKPEKPYESKKPEIQIVVDRTMKEMERSVKENSALLTESERANSFRLEKVAEYDGSPRLSGIQHYDKKLDIPPEKLIQLKEEQISDIKQPEIAKRMNSKKVSENVRESRSKDAKLPYVLKQENGKVNGSDKSENYEKQNIKQQPFKIINDSKCPEAAQQHAGIEDNIVRMPDITITIEISDESEDVKYSNKGNNGEFEPKEDEERNIINALEGREDTEEGIEYLLREKGDNVGIVSNETTPNNVGDVLYSVGNTKDTTIFNMRYPSGENRRSEGDLKYSVEEVVFKNTKCSARKESMPYVEKNVMIAKNEGGRGNIHNCRNCSRIPRRIYSRNMIKELIGEKLCLCDISTNTDKVELIERAEQWGSRTDGSVILYKKCRQCIDKISDINHKNSPVPDRKCGKINDSKSKPRSYMKRSSSFVCSNKNTDKFETCPKKCRRPSTASNIYDLTNRFDSEYKARDESAGGQTWKKSSEEALVRVCQPRSELPPLNKYGMSKGKDFLGHKNISDRAQGCTKKTTQTDSLEFKKCSQTGGTLQQDMIASYVASCCSNAESLPPEKFIIQTLLYQFAGYDPNKDQVPPKRTNSIERSSPQLRQPSKNAMRSVQIQVGSSYPPKCETVQTLTTFILTDPHTNLPTQIMPTTGGKINLVCGPDIPGIRTKVALNVNQLPSVQENESCISEPKTSHEQSESNKHSGSNEHPALFEQYNSPSCSYNQSGNIEENETPAQVVKNDKYIFITVTPVQTEPYEPNYYIILTNPEEEAETKKETKNKKNLKSGTKLKADKNPNIPSNTKNPLDHFKNQIFSLDTLKSSDFLEYFGKKPDALQKSRIIGPPSDANKVSGLKKLLQNKTEQGSESPISTEKHKRVEKRECGPETCKNLKTSSDNDMRSEKLNINVENREFGSETCEYFPQKKTENKGCGPETCEPCEASEENELTNGILSDNVNTNKNAVNTPRKPYHQQDEENEVDTQKVDVSTSPSEPNVTKTEDVQCGNDTCDFKTVEGTGIIDSTQDEESTPNINELNGLPEDEELKAGCDACTITDFPEEEIVSSKPEYCDKQVCTNDCEKGDVASQVCIGNSFCSPDACDKFCENIKVEADSEIQNASNLPSSTSAEKQEEPVQDAVSCASNCDPNDCDYVEELKKQKNSEAESKDLKECHDKVCPEKATSSSDKHRDERVLEEKERFHQKEDSKFPMKILNAKLNDQDVFALKLAIDRFAKTKPNPMDEEE